MNINACEPRRGADKGEKPTPATAVREYQNNNIYNMWRNLINYVHARAKWAATLRRMGARGRRGVSTPDRSNYKHLNHDGAAQHSDGETPTGACM